MKTIWVITIAVVALGAGFTAGWFLSKDGKEATATATTPATTPAV